MMLVGIIIFGGAVWSHYNDATFACMVIGAGMVVIGLIKYIVKHSNR